ncbi:ATP-binding protein [Synechococcus sp. CS-1325]|uniref:ATP-binding protein n=1 Tax=Synechococcus sp. CS-1325 TaxID=2847979 RepID=UPI000DB5EC86|nr:ATP-binding protein [Synechococcus sp. CS-1325]MCT0199307.1 ATP-binding protein [Synechococcus sp. CS-1325]PZU98513.1 MAG: ATPase [Cyanobium sp.]
MAEVFHRPRLAAELAGRLLHPGVLDEGLRSGLFLSGLRRTGKTTFLLTDLVPELEAQGAVVVYVDLWSDIKVSPATLVYAAVRRVLADLVTPTSTPLARLRRLRGLDLGGMGFRFGFQLEQLGEPGGATLAQALTEVVDQAQGDVVLIVDEVQQAITTEEGNQMLLALKAARDAINPRPGTPGHFLFLGTGSHRALVGELTARRNQAFAGATSLPYPVLDLEYVRHVLQRLREENVKPLPAEEIAWRAFQTLGHRPEEFLRALGQLQASLRSGSGLMPDELLPVIAATLRGSAADLELQKVEQLGGLAMAIFDRVARDDGPAKGLFSAEAAAAYGDAIGREVRVEEIQPVVNELLADNVLMRLGHGLYGVADPFVQEIWQERRQ